MCKSSCERQLWKKWDTTRNLRNKTPFLIRHDKSCSLRVLSHDHQKSQHNHTYTDELFDQIKTKCQDLRPSNIVLPEISDADSTGRLCLQRTWSGSIRGHPSPRPLLILYFYNSGERLITHQNLWPHLPPHKCPLKFLIPVNIHCWPDFQPCATTGRSPLEIASDAI